MPCCVLMSAVVSESEGEEGEKPSPFLLIRKKPSERDKYLKNCSIATTEFYTQLSHGTYFPVRSTLIIHQPSDFVAVFWLFAFIFFQISSQRLNSMLLVFFLRKEEKSILIMHEWSGRMLLRCTFGREKFYWSFGTAKCKSHCECAQIKDRQRDALLL